MSWFRRRYSPLPPVFRDTTYDNPPAFAFEKSDAKDLTFTVDGRLVKVCLKASLLETRREVSKILVCSVLELDGAPIEPALQERTRRSLFIDEETPLTEQYKTLIEAALYQFGIKGKSIMPASPELIDGYQRIHKLRQRVGRRRGEDVAH